MNVRFYLKYPKKDSSAIYVEFYFKGARVKIYPGITVQTSFWNIDKMKCQGGVKYKEGKEINELLEAITGDIIAVSHQFNRDKIKPTAAEFVEAYKAYAFGVKKDPMKFVDYIEYKVDEYEKHKMVNEGTIKGYRSAVKLLRKFEKDKRKKLVFDDINMRFYNSFLTWYNKQVNPQTKKNYSVSYFGKTIKDIKKFMNAALDEEPPLHENKGHLHKDFKKLDEEADTIYLDMEELKKIADLDLSPEFVQDFYDQKQIDLEDNGKVLITEPNLMKKAESMRIVRNRFLIGAFSLLRVSDYKRLSELNMQKGFIRIRPQKSKDGKKNRDVIVPMHPIVKKIVESGFSLSESVADSKINKHIKEICEMAGIDEEVVVSRTEGGVIKEYSKKKYELVTTHTARRSAATNMLMAGIPVSDIMILGGWKTEKSFWKYIRMEAEVNAQRLAGHSFFK